MNNSGNCCHKLLLALSEKITENKLKKQLEIWRFWWIKSFIMLVNSLFFIIRTLIPKCELFLNKIAKIYFFCQILTIDMTMVGNTGKALSCYIPNLLISKLWVPSKEGLTFITFYNGLFLKMVEDLSLTKRDIFKCHCLPDNFESLYFSA